jgi:hypothetical protein
MVNSPLIMVNNGWFIMIDDTGSMVHNGSAMLMVNDNASGIMVHNA